MERRTESDYKRLTLMCFPVHLATEINCGTSLQRIRVCLARGRQAAIQTVKETSSVATSVSGVAQPRHSSAAAPPSAVR